MSQVYQSIRYNGTYKRKITWNSMGQCFSYNVCPGDVIDVPMSQYRNAMACGPFTKVKTKVTKPKKVRKTSEYVSNEPEVAQEETLVIEDVVDPFEVEVEIDDEDVAEEAFVEPEFVEEPATEVEEVVEVEEKPNTDFAAMNKTELSQWLIDNGVEGTVDELMKNLKDTLITMCVEKEATL
jgi:hypothetical protein